MSCIDNSDTDLLRGNQDWGDVTPDKGKDEFDTMGLSKIIIIFSLLR